MGMCCRLRTKPDRARSYDDTAHEGEKKQMCEGVTCRLRSGSVAFVSGTPSSMATMVAIGGVRTEMRCRNATGGSRPFDAPSATGSVTTPHGGNMRLSCRQSAIWPARCLRRDFEFRSINTDRFQRCSNSARSKSTDQDRPTRSGRLTRPADQTRPKQFGRILRSPDQTSLYIRLVWSGRMIGGRIGCFERSFWSGRLAMTSPVVDERRAGRRCHSHSRN